MIFILIRFVTVLLCLFGYVLLFDIACQMLEKREKI